MSRAIKFRAWDTVRKKMFSAEEMGQDQLTLSPDGRGFINVHGKHTRLSQYLPHLLPLEFTGLLDKNGKIEKCDGDVVRGNDGIVRVVEWLSGGFIEREDVRKYKLVDNQGEVIGNRFENPELLEKAK